MTLALRVEQGQRLATTPQMRLALDVLSMSTDALCDHLRAAAAANPFLDLSWPSSASGSGPDDLPDLAEECGLYAHVLAQIPLCLPAGRPREIALCFADALEPTGWLGLPLDRIAAASGCSLNEARSVLDGLQRMEPAGLFARDLRECLRLQAADLGCDSPAMLRILDRLDLVAAGDPAALAAACGISPDDAAACLMRIRGMDPKPGARFSTDPTLARAPDLVVTEANGRWHVALNRSDMPAVRIADPGRNVTLSPELGDALRAATWLQRAVAQRHQTTLTVVSELLRRQGDFLARGPAALRPLSQRDLARTLGIHESTVSRVVAGLTIATPHGVFAVKALFTHASGPDGRGPSAAALRHRIAALIRSEDPARPLSDGAIMERLCAENLTVARRTVTKHREALGLPPAQDRRRAHGACLRAGLALPTGGSARGQA